ncbi:MAG: rhodanese-like domain-containing protein [Pedobacter sp.]|uniref:rhodanese-like domain-containing protein n=1 Tax=Pedobacter sp. TaxID=1411316 RepID=UPI002806A22F|nr:rhodanese-like domain-containing protein [Pedobacter sp.]MDQ8006052.1 rhodanese-like domain-containing protein [Pedobacter sp.]
MRKLILFLLPISLLFFNANAQEKSNVKKISPRKLERKLKKNIQLIDVRTEKEFAEQHIEKAVNVNIEDINFEKAVQSLDKGKPVYLYCRSGKRSSKAAKKLDSLGFQKIYDLEGGINSWNKKKGRKP